MKVAALFALSALASAAFAATPSSINIGGTSVQTTNNTGAYVANTSGANNAAFQNISSNAGGVSIERGGSSNQTTNLNGGGVTNEAKDTNAVARQNLASNNGEVTIKAASNQTVNTNSAGVSNMADGNHAQAIQNIASNFGRVDINHASTQVANLNWGSNTVNLAKGTNSYAVQNVSSNDACAEDPCPGGRCGPTYTPRYNNN